MEVALNWFPIFVRPPITVRRRSASNFVITFDSLTFEVVLMKTARGYFAE